ncbi:MAG: 2-C-methyl-D-erythritol 4-phosphate cytidylyltransferase [Flavobacteriales bacterium TMED84]|nr:MAG: 2-C-methyl-D-erythritol 4-phosphate cytidylyltransferase [Flavobacteriales bacterium TMED84]
MKKSVLILGAGSGTRMNNKLPKQYILIKDKPIIFHTIEKFGHFDEIVVVINKNHISLFEKHLNDNRHKNKIKLVFGGKTRIESVRNGLKYVDENSNVAIHDAVRPLISKAMIDKLISSVKNNCIVPGAKLKDSARVFENGKAVYINREKIIKIQTPQCFYAKDIKEAYSNLEDFSLTDDASVFEMNGGKIEVIEGEEFNIKVTTPFDLEIVKINYEKL